MRSLKVVGSALTAALVLASPALASTWDLQGTVRHGHGTLDLTSGTQAVTCTVTLNLKASGAVATTTDASGSPAGPTFNNCSNNLGLSPTHVTATGAWTATATSTTAVDLNFNYVLNIGSGTCVVSAVAAVPNNWWSNATHTLTASSASSWPISRTGFCPLTAATATWSGSIVFPASLVIT